MNPSELMAWQEKERSNSADALSQAFLDPETWGGNWTSEHQALVDQTIDPEATKKAVANRDWIATQEGKSPDEIAPFLPAYRKAYAQKFFRKPDMGDSELYGAIRERYQGEKARAGLENKLLGTALTQLSENQQANPAEIVQKFHDLNPDVNKGLDANQAAEAKKGHMELISKISEGARSDAPALGVVFRGIMNMTGQIPDEKAPTMGDVVSELAMMPPEKRQGAYDAMTLMLHDKGLDTKKELENFGDALGRGTIGIVNQMARVAFEETQRADLETYQDMLKRETESPAPVSDFDPLIHLNAAQLEEKIAKIKGNLEAIKIIREVQAQAQKLDPVRSAKKGLTGFALNAAYGATQSLGYMGISAVPVIGGPLMFYSIAADKQERLMLENHDMDPAHARNAAYAFALLSAIMESFQMGLFRGKAPIFFETMKAMKMGAAKPLERGGRILGDLAVRTGGEFSVEMGQGVLEAAFDALRQDRKGFDFKTELKNLAGTAPESLATMFVMSLVGTGIASIREIRNGNALLKSTETLRGAGFDNAQVADIITQPTDVEREKKFMDIWDKRTPENIAKGKEIQKAAAAKAASLQKSSSTPTRESVLQDDGTFLHTIKAADGRVLLQTADADQADMAMDDEMKAHAAGVSADVREAMAFIKNYQYAIGRGEDLKLTLEGAPKSFLQLYNANPTQKNLDRFFETVRQIPEEITQPGQLANYFAVARNEGKIIEGIYKSVISISNGANAKHTLREMAQDNLKRAMVEEGVTIEWVREQLDAMKSGDKAVKGYEAMVTDTDTAVIESFSDLAVNLFTGKTKDAEIPTGLRSFLRQLAVAAREIAYQVFHLKRAMADGRVNKDFHEFLARSVGLDLDAQLKIEGAKAMRQMEQEALDALHSGDGAYGDEMLAVFKRGKLPDEKSKFWNEDFARLKEAVKEQNKGKERKDQIKLSSIFSNDASDPDLLIPVFNGQGHPFFTVDDMVQAVEERLRTGKPMPGYTSNESLQGEHYSVVKKGTPAIADRGSESPRLWGSSDSSERNQAQASIHPHVGGEVSFDGVKLPQWQAARQQENLSEKSRAAQSRRDEAVKELENAERSAERSRKEWESRHGRTWARFLPERASVFYGDAEGNDYLRYSEQVSPITDLRGTVIYKNGVKTTVPVDASPQHIIDLLEKHNKTVVIERDRAVGRVVDQHGKIYFQLSRFDYAPFPEPSELVSARKQLSQAEADLFLALEEEGGYAANMAAKESAAVWARRTKAAEFAALLDARDEKARNAANSFISDIWSAFGKHDEVFQYGRTDSKDADDIAEAVSSPGKPVTVSDRGEQITFIGKEGPLTIHEADTARPYIRSTEAKSQGKEDGGGSQLYAAALDWIHNNGKRIKDDSGLTAINASRRTSNFLASAIRWGTARHLKPHAGQGLKWTKSDVLNTAALAAKEMENAFKAIPDARGWEYDFASGQFRDDAGNNVTREGFATAVRMGDPGKSGIGLATLQRAIITRSAIRAFERGETSESVLDAAGRGVVPSNVTYSIVRKEDLDPDRVQKDLDARMRDPAERLAIYERAKAMFVAAREKRADAIDPNRKFESLRQSMGELNAILSVFPAEIRGKVGGMLTLANMGKDTVAGNREATIDKFLVERIEMLDREFERALSADYRTAILKLVEKSRPKAGDNGVKRSTLGAKTQAFADSVRRATLLDTDATAERMAAIEESLKTAGAEDAAKLMQEWGILNSFGDIDSMDAESLAASHALLKTALKAGREAWAINEQARIDRHRAAVNDWLESIAGGSDSGRWKEKGSLKRFLERANAFDLDHKSFENFVRAITTDEIANDLGNRMRIADNAAQDMEIAHREGLMQAIRDAAKASGMSAGKAVLHLMESQKGVVDYLSGRMVTNERLTIEQAEKVVRGEINPSKLSKADIESLRDELAAIPADSQKEYVTVKRVISKGRNISIDMSRDRAIQVLLTWAQPDAREKLRREGWQESSVTQLMKMTNDPISQAVMGHLKGYYAENAKTVNPVYAGMFGMNLPQLQNYAPTRFINKQDTRDVGPDGVPQVSGSTPGFFKGRTNHSAKLAPAGAMEVFGGHVSQTAHWVNFAELSRDFRGIVANSQVREAIKESLGDPVLDTAEAWADLLEQRGGNRAREASWVNSLLGAFIGGRAISSLGFNVKTILMQTDSAMRAIAAIDMRQLANALADPAGLAASMPDVWNSPTVQRRLKGGMNPEAKFIFSKFAGKPGVGAHVAMASMTPIQFFDATATTLSSAIVFRSTYKDAIASGMNEIMATNAAMDAMDAAVYRFSQPTSFGSKSRVENTGGSIQKLFTLFMSDPRLKSAMIADAVRGLATGKGNKGDHIRRIVAVELMGLMSWLLAAGYRDLTSDDTDEEIYTMGGFAQSILLAPLQGYLFAGTVASSALTYLTGKMPYQSSRDPFVDTVDRASRAVKHIEDAANFSDPDALLKEWDNIARTISIHPDLAALAVLINAVKPLVGIKQNLENPE